MKKIIATLATLAMTISVFGQEAFEKDILEYVGNNNNILYFKNTANEEIMSFQFYDNQQILKDFETNHEQYISQLFEVTHEMRKKATGEILDDSKQIKILSFDNIDVLISAIELKKKNQGLIGFSSK